MVLNIWRLVSVICIHIEYYLILPTRLYSMKTSMKKTKHENALSADYCSLHRTMTAGGAAVHPVPIFRTLTYTTL